MTSGSDSVDHGVGRRTGAARDQLQAIRRSLWILNSTLESMPAKIELATRTSGVLAGRSGLNRPQHSSDEAGNERLALAAEGALDRWRMRWERARLQSRAARAERRAAVAIRTASASFGAALDSVLHAAIARLQADRACRDCLGSASRSPEETDDRAIIDMLKRNAS